jgi:hypothetical protein
MIGMAVGLSVLAAYGSTVIAGLYDQVYGTPDGYKAFIAPDLRDRPLKDGLVVDALESWAAEEASKVMTGIFFVAGGLTLAALPATLALGGRARMLHPRPATAGTTEPGSAPTAAGAPGPTAAPTADLPEGEGEGSAEEAATIAL